MKRLITLLLLPSPAVAVPVIPNFSQGVVSSHTESKTIVKESIVSESYRTGFEYTVSGTGVEPTSGSLAHHQRQPISTSQAAPAGNRLFQVQRFSLSKRFKVLA